MSIFDKELTEQFYEGATIYKAMKFWSLPKHKRHEIKEVCASGEYFGQTKKDGNWYAYTKGSNGEHFLFSRGVSVKTNLPVEAIDKVPHLKEAFKDLPNDTVILGEIYYPGKTTAAVRSIMGCLPPKAIERQKEKGNIHFYMFDIVRYDGEDLTDMGARDRYLKLKEIVDSYSLLDTEELELADCVEENLYQFLIDNFAKGEEGSILKKKDYPYVGGKSPAWSSVKWKKQDDIDVVCMGFEDPTKEYTGKEVESWLYWEVDGDLKEGLYYGEDGAIPVTKPYFHGWKMSAQFGLYHEDQLIPIGTVSSGMTDELRADAAKNPDKYIGRVMKLNYMELTDDSVREPILIEFRDDKPAEECLYEEVFR